MLAHAGSGCSTPLPGAARLGVPHGEPVTGGDAPGRVANGINTVHLSYVRERTGHALIGARQWIPRGQIEDPVRSLVMALPPDLEFRTRLRRHFEAGGRGMCCGYRRASWSPLEAAHGIDPAARVCMCRATTRSAQPEG